MSSSTSRPRPQRGASRARTGFRRMKEGEKMRYQISGKQIDIGTALQTHVKQELGDAVAKYAERPTDAHVVFSKSGNEFHCESIIHLSTGLTAQAKAHSHEIY